MRFIPSRDTTIKAIAVDAEFQKDFQRSFTALSHLAIQNNCAIRGKLFLAALANCAERYVYGVLDSTLFLEIIFRSHINEECAGSHQNTCCFD